MSDAIPDERAALLAAVRAEPDDDTPRLVYADWLEERDGLADCGVCVGKGGWESLLSRVRREKPPHPWEKCFECDGTGRIPNGHADRAEFIRVQCELAKGVPPHPNGHIDVGPDTRMFINPDIECARHDCRLCHLRRRERELFDKHEHPFPGGPPPLGCWSRGFVSRLSRVSWEWWVNNHAAILAHPDVVLREVRLTTEPQVEIIGADERRRVEVRWLDTGTTTKAAYSEDEHVYWDNILHSCFPGHCPGHPIRWVLPGDDRDVTNSGVPCPACGGAGYGDMDFGDVNVPACGGCGGTGWVAGGGS